MNKIGIEAVATNLGTKIKVGAEPNEADAVGALIRNIYRSRTVMGADDQTYEIYPAHPSSDWRAVEGRAPRPEVQC